LDDKPRGGSLICRSRSATGVSFFLIAAGALLTGSVIFFLGVLKGKEIEARLQRRSQKISRSILGGVFSEQIAPFLPDFPKDLKASEARFIGKPIDFLIFKGMDDQRIDEVVSGEIKTGNSQLSPNERTLRDAIEAKRVRWHEYHVDHSIAVLGRCLEPSCRVGAT
jgi:Endonuclease related to archaeal Holliday junction resolvase